MVFTRWQGIELMNYSPLVYCYGQRNIAITGQGTLNGQADANHWWNWKDLETADFDLLETMADDNVPVSQRVFGAGHFLPPQMIQPFLTDTVLLQGVTFINSPFWHLNPNLCNNVTVEGVTINSSGPNTDGCDPESCYGVVIDRSRSTPATTASRSSPAATPTAAGSTCPARTWSSRTATSPTGTAASPSAAR